MAFSVSGWALLFSAPSQSGWAYETTDTLAACLADGYFTDVRNSLRANDRISIEAGDGAAEVKVVRSAETVTVTAGARAVVSPQIIATRGVLAHTAITGYTTLEGRGTVQNGGYDATDVQLALAAFLVNSNATGEAALTTAITMSAAIETISPAVKAWLCTFGNALSFSAPAALGGIVLTDPVGIDLAAGQTFKVQLGQIVATTGDTLAATNLSGPTLMDGYRSTTNSTVQIGTASTWSATGRSATSNAILPAAIIGRPSQNYPSVVFVGDSIMQCRDDNTGDAYGHHGFGPRGMVGAGVNGVMMPFANLARSGETMQSLVAGGYVRRFSLLKYCSHVICNLGTNDVQGGRTFALLKADYLAGWAMMKRRGVQVFQTTISPRTTSTDSWATAANQTVVAGFGIGGVRDQINAWMKTQVGVTIDGVIDVNPVLEDPANPSKWITTGAALYATSDGTHHSDAGAALAATKVLAAAQAFTMPTTVRL